jgi:hypothetical protein
MKTTNIITFLSLSLLVSCTSFKKDYVITDASRNSKPSWVKTEKKENDSNYYYFVSSANIRKKVCIAKTHFPNSVFRRASINK